MIAALELFRRNAALETTVSAVDPLLVLNWRDDGEKG